MTLKHSFIYKLLFNRSELFIDNPTDYSKLHHHFHQFRRKYISTQLIRIGGDGDGGYLLPPILDRIDYCFSPGVSTIADFEDHISQDYGIRSFLADANVESAPIDNRHFSFTKKFLGHTNSGIYMTLGRWVSDSVPDDAANLLLQMEFEGAEYSVLIHEDIDTLERFACMVIEFHGMDRLFREDFFLMHSDIMEKIYSLFSVVHAHPNNCCGFVERGGVRVPRVVELTFLRNDLVKPFQTNEEICLPHSLDRKNVSRHRDLVLPEIWWKS